MASSKVLILFLSTLSLFVCFPILIQAEVVHITVLAAGYTNVDTFNVDTRLQYQCYASEPDRDASLSFDRPAPITTDRSPPGDEPHIGLSMISPLALVRVVEFPPGEGWDRDGFGPFYCEASKPGRDVTRVTTFFQRSDAKFIPSDESFTKTVNVNDTGVMISMDNLVSPDASDNAITWMKDGSDVLTSFGGQTEISFPNPIQTSDQGIYEIYYNNERNQSRGGLYRLIVRECPTGKWGPPECYGICDKCYNGGVCDDKSGLCICPNNFKGPSCLEIAPSPINLAISQSTISSFTVSWSTPLPSNINGNIEKYIIRYKRTDLVAVGGYKMEEVLNGAFEGEHTVIDLIAETIYSVQVRTVNGAGFSNWSEPVNAKTIQSGGPSSASVGLIGGGAMAALIIIILVIVLALVIFRRKKQRRS